MRNYTTQMDAARKGIPDAGDEDGSKEGEDAGGTADEARGRRKGGDLRQQKP